MRDCPRIVIAGTNSGAGKTSLAVALTAALRRRGLRVQTFKVGPDFLDPSYLARASGRPCYNLDGWMNGRTYVEQLFTRATRDADLAVVEGVMGLFDGADPATSAGSTAEIARWLNAPILLILNAHGVARSLAATVKGFATFEEGITLAGAIANHCGSERHAQWLAESLRAAALPPLLGAIPRDAWPPLPSRHLGLVTADGHNLSPGVLDQLADVLERNIPLEEILQLARRAPALVEIPDEEQAPAAARTFRLGLAEDQAFHFYYPDNLEALERHGCALERFSPLADERLPEGLDALYIGGGYPEEHAESLAANQPLRQAVRRFAASGRPVYGECGGLMFLSQGIQTLDGKRQPMAGLLPCWTRMLPRRKALGYVEATLLENSLFGRRGDRLRGHEFHYSELIDPDAIDPADKKNGHWSAPYTLLRRRVSRPEPEGFQRGRVTASYMHAHFASAPGAAGHFAQICRRITHDT